MLEMFGSQNLIRHRLLILAYVRKSNVYIYMYVEVKTLNQSIVFSQHKHSNLNSFA